LPSVLWHCRLGISKSIRPVKNWVMTYWRGYLSGARCTWFAYGWCHCHPIVSCFIKIQIVCIFLVPAYTGCSGKEAVKQVSVCQKRTKPWPQVTCTENLVKLDMWFVTYMSRQTDIQIHPSWRWSNTIRILSAMKSLLQRFNNSNVILYM